MRVIQAILGAILITCCMGSYAETATEVVCSYAPSQNAAVNRISGAVGGAGVGAAAIMQAAGLTAVAHSSGAYILTSSGGYVAGTIGGAAAVPFLIAASVVVAGTAVVVELSCAPKNHPNAIKAVKDFSDVFARETKGKLDDLQQLAVTKVRDWNSDAIDIREKAKDRVRAANSVAIEYKDSALGYFSR